MGQLIINDLPMSLELDRTALKTVRGGLRGKVVMEDIVCVKVMDAADEQPTNPLKAATALEYAILI